MARQVRIEFPGAFYHVMARGNRLDPIFVSPDGADEELFLKTLGEACERSGFVIWAWVLMRNHYHLVLQTPKANLVAGMAWLQNTYTRRFNVRHKAWGRLFGDRYKSILIDDDRSGGGSSYLATLLDYVHLNPARARIISPGKENRSSLLDYPWSSISHAYALAPGKRVPWLNAAAGLELFGLRDTARDRRRFVERLDGRMAEEEAKRCGLAEIEGQTLNSTLRRGWYWGSEEFKESMLHLLDQRNDTEEGLPTSRSYQSDDQASDLAEIAAEQIVADGVKHFRLQGADREHIAALPRGDERRDAIAWALWKKTTLPQRWIANRLNLRSAANVSDRVRKFDKTDPKAQTSEVLKWRKGV
jgi:putative transposase